MSDHDNRNRPPPGCAEVVGKTRVLSHHPMPPPTTSS